MTAKTTIALLGAGGYGHVYLGPLLDPAVAARQNVRLVAAVEPNPNAADAHARLKAAGVPAFAGSAEMYARCRPDVVVIASPIHFHARQTVEALSHGSHVLCEKPLCATVEQSRLMREAESVSPGRVAIGYQWSFSPAIRRLKNDILAGEFGRAVRCKSLTLWPRDEAYYARNGWAGRRTTDAGLAVYDSPINNACAHFLHNLLYLLGPTAGTSAAPHAVTAETYRANAIETFDTAAVRATVGDGVELLMIASHATAEAFEPVFELRFERATVSYDAGGAGRLVAAFDDGRTRDYGVPAGPACADKLWAAVAAFAGGLPLACGIEAATPQTQVVAAIHKAVPEAAAFPPSIVRVCGTPGRRTTAVAALGETLARCYVEWRLPYEVGASWAMPSQTVRLGEAGPARAGAVREATPVVADLINAAV